MNRWINVLMNLWIDKLMNRLINVFNELMNW